MARNIPTPTSWASGETLTAAKMNSQVFDTANLLVNSPLVKVNLGTGSITPSSTLTTFTAITWSAETRDNDTMWAATAPTRVTFTTPGLYLVTLQTVWASNTTGQRFTGIRYFDGTLLAGCLDDVDDGYSIQNVSCLVNDSSGGGYVEGVCSASTSVAMGYQSAWGLTPSMTAVWVGFAAA